jgi:hypothetical protein
MTMTFAVLFLLAQASQPRPIVPELSQMMGPWECLDSNGIHGIFIAGMTQSSGEGTSKKIDWQSVSIFVYERMGNQQKGGYFSPGHHDSGGGTDLTNDRLTILFKGLSSLSGFDMDLNFDSLAQRWRGTWSLCKSVDGEVTLLRPHPASGSSIAPIVGDWDSIPNRKIEMPGRLHATQSVDGKIWAWLDLVSRSQDFRTHTVTVQESSMQLKFDSVASGNAVLTTMDGIGPVYSLEPSIDSTGQRLSGEWRNTAPGSMGISSASGQSFFAGPTLYQRVK